MHAREGAGVCSTTALRRALPADLVEIVRFCSRILAGKVSGARLNDTQRIPHPATRIPQLASRISQPKTDKLFFNNDLELDLVTLAAWSSLHVGCHRITLDGLRLGVPFDLAVEANSNVT